MNDFMSPFLGLSPGTNLFSIFFMAALCLGALPFFFHDSQSSGHCCQPISAGRRWVFHLPARLRAPRAAKFFLCFPTEEVNLLARTVFVS
jgi:hypothetical protein